MINGSFFYVLIEKATSRCFQTIDTDTPNWSVNDDYAYSIEVAIRADYLDKFFYNNTWYSRTYNEYDENGIPVESAGYIDTEWIPSN